MPNSTRFATIIALVAGLLLPSIAIGCLWDYDTIKMERTRFPSTLELITGKFLRHSPEFYKWRIENRLKRLESDPTNVSLLDDLAVAYDKSDQNDKAIETALKTEKLYPGRYETAANLGSFYFHSGKLSEGIPHIDKALQINPDAHFGREKYQKLLVEYVLKQRNGGPLKLPLAKVENQSQKDFPVFEDFAHFMNRALQGGKDMLLAPEEFAASIKGILGMMKFGKHDSPVLLEALGTLLTFNENDPNKDAKLLACRAYLKASYEVSEETTKSSYRGMAHRALIFQTIPGSNHQQITLEMVEADFKKELAEANKWYAELRERELSWIREGKDPEAEFDKLYDVEPEVSGMGVQDPLAPKQRSRLFLLTVISLILLTYWSLR
jgi:tetratricopeptide (TPR) repeat protein